MASLKTVSSSQSSVDRKALAERLKDRRKHGGLTRTELAGLIGVSETTLAAWERMLPNQAHPAEVAMEKVLQVPAGWLRNSNMVEVLDSAPVRIPGKCATVADEIRAVGCWLARSASFRRTFNFADLTPADLRSADLFAQRFGILGEDQSTLQAVGVAHGITRERVRQVINEMVARAQGMSIVLPHLDRLAEAIEARPLVAVTALNQELRHILGAELTIMDANQFSQEVLGKEIAHTATLAAGLSSPAGTVTIIPQGHNEDANMVVWETVKAMIRNCGAAHISFVAGMASRTLGCGISADETEAYCKLIPGFEWLMEYDGWFWVGPVAENRLIAVAKKLLAVADRAVDVEEIHAALVRSRRSIYGVNRPRPCLIELPSMAVAEVLKRVPGIHLKQINNFYADPPILPKDVLSETELAVFELMVAHGGVAAKYTLAKTLVVPELVKHMTLEVCLSGSPIFTPIDFGLYAIKGHTLNPDFLKSEALMVRGPAREGKQDSDGVGVRCSFTLSEEMLKSRLFIVPSVLAQVMSPGMYVVQGFDKPAHLHELNEFDTGLSQFVEKLTELGFKVGESGEMSLDTVARIIVINPVKQDLPAFEKATEKQAAAYSAGAKLKLGGDVLRKD